MATHTLERTQDLAIAPDEAWEFFSSPRNLEQITPKDLRFRIVSVEGERMFEGQKIVYLIRLAPLVWVKWVTVIQEVEEGRSFVDTQAAGPYKLWHHRHEFDPLPDREGVRMRDTVHYSIGFGPLGALAHRLFVRSKVNRIFDHRFEVLEKKFGRPGKTAAAA